jgi:hypothetical protein
MSISVVDQLRFSGTEAEQASAKRLFSALSGHGRFIATNAPIRVKLESVIDFFESIQPGADETSVQRIAELNPGIFSIDVVDDEKFLITTREGVAETARTIDGSHTFQDRLLKPEPKPETPPAPIRVRPRVDASWATLDQVLKDFELEDEEPTDLLEDDPEIDLEPTESAAVEQDDVEDAAPAARTIVVPAGSMTDVAGIEDVELAEAIRGRLSADPRVATFADQWMMEDRVPRFSRGDLRRLKDYIQEQEQPLTDEMLVQDVLEIRPRSSDFELMRFALNFRLAKEHRDFDFVGTSNQRFWSVSSLPQIGTTRRKPTEIGTDYRFLVEGSEQKKSAYRSQTVIDHVLTFYESQLGLLPYDADMQSLLPGPIEPAQRSAVLTFECPQSYTTYLVELRYPTPNRGGFILGLDDFYNENLVPGALLTIKATENDGHYLVEYVAGSTENARLLELEERRQRYVFRPTTFACGVLEEFMLNEDRFAGFSGEKPLDDKARRRPEAVIAATFERLNKQIEGSGYWASFQDLLAGVNVERPFSENYLRSVLDNDESGAFARDPDGADAYTYVPGTTS